MGIMMGVMPAGLLGGADNLQLAAMHAAIVDAAAAPKPSAAAAAENSEGPKAGMFPPCPSLLHVIRQGPALADMHNCLGCCLQAGFHH